LKAIVIDTDKALHWQDVPDPVMADGEVLIEIHAAAVNRADIMQRQGNYPPPPGAPEWMGLEVAGVIKDLSPKAAATGKWKKGDEVCALLGGGGYAEAASVRQDMVMPIPKGFSMTQSAALPEVFATSYLNLFLEGHLEAGQTAFIPAGASGLASAAIPMAKAFGARVITSVLSDEIAVASKDLGADITINSKKQKIAEVLRAEADAGHPVNVAMDCLAGQDVGDSLPYMARGGYWILLSVLAGPAANISLWPLITGGVHLVGSTLRSRSPDMKGRILGELVKNVWPKIEAGKIKSRVCAVFPVQEAEKAHEMMEQGRSIGKIVLEVK
jgi:putative PIG3 family NAD(P)H quinone oxidoreductase